MSMYEAEAYVRGVQRRARAGWEQARYIAYCTLKPWSKDLDIKDMISFPWETDTEDFSEEEQANAISALRNRVQEFTNFINQK